MENLFFIDPRHLPHGLPLAANGLVACTTTLLIFSPGPFYLCERGQLWQAAGENSPYERLLLPYNSVEWAYHNGRCFQLEFAQGRLKNIRIYPF